MFFYWIFEILAAKFFFSWRCTVVSWMQALLCIVTIAPEWKTNKWNWDDPKLSDPVTSFKWKSPSRNSCLNKPLSANAEKPFEIESCKASARLSELLVELSWAERDRCSIADKELVICGRLKSLLTEWSTAARWQTARLWSAPASPLGVQVLIESVADEFSLQWTERHLATRSRWLRTASAVQQTNEFEWDADGPLFHRITCAIPPSLRF